MTNPLDDSVLAAIAARFDSGVSVGGGWPLEPGASIDIEANPQVALWAIGSGGDLLAVMELAGAPVV